MPQHQVPSESLQCVQADIAQNVAFGFLELCIDFWGCGNQPAQKGLFTLFIGGNTETTSALGSFCQPTFWQKFFFLDKDWKGQVPSLSGWNVH